MHRPRFGGVFVDGGCSGQQMNWNRIAGNWKQFKGSARQQWGRLTEDDLEVVAGKREHLAGMIQEAYGITREASRKQLSEWLARQHKTDPIHK